MIAYVKGELAYKNESSAIVDVGGVGYLVNMSATTASRLPACGEVVQLFTHFQVSDNGQALHGFVSREELQMFTQLIAVSGIGPKVASAILGAMTPQQIILAVMAEDAAALSKAPGVGKKTAQRALLELKDKIKTDWGDAGEIGAALPSGFAAAASTAKQDAADALIALGYSRTEAVQAVLETADENMKAEEIIKLSLKKLSRQG